MVAAFLGFCKARRIINTAIRNTRHFKMNRIVIDCDTGVDDALALTIALRFPNVSVEGITCVAGNTGLGHVVRNTLSVVTCMNRQIPIYAGCHHTILRRKHTFQTMDSAELTHSANGFGGVTHELEKEHWNLVQKEHGALALCRMAKEQPGQLTLVALAPLTNIAMAMRLDPEFSSNLREIIIMGGNYKGI